jgi:hypothetical protein
MVCRFVTPMIFSMPFSPAQPYFISLASFSLIELASWLRVIAAAACHASWPTLMPLRQPHFDDIFFRKNAIIATAISILIAFEYFHFIITFAISIDITGYFFHIFSTAFDFLR